MPDDEGGHAPGALPELKVSFDTLLVEESGVILRVRINRPESQNSITSTVLDELDRALDRAQRSPTCRIVVMEGVNGTFCTGMDLGEAGAEDGAPADLVSDAARFFGLLRRLTCIPRVVVSTVDGRASGGGIGLVAASDFVLATPRSRFGLPEALWGLVPCCVLPFLIRRIGFQKAYTMALCTASIGAREAEGFHLVDEVSDEPEVQLRRLSVRLTRVQGSTIADLKRYCGGLWPISQEAERAAVAEFGRLATSEPVRLALARFATQQRFPWEP